MSSVTDLDRTVAFHRDTLGLTCPVHMPERGFAEFADPDGNALMLHHRYAPRASAA
jgi:hypothetical protein